jgi:hypothetical protein
VRTLIPPPPPWHTHTEGLDRKKIEALLKTKFPKLEIHTYQV